MSNKLPITKNNKERTNRSNGSVFFIKKTAILTLEDGQIFAGSVPEGQEEAIGEVVFNTGMTGYVESLTDPSYTNQILVFTYPLIGNYGVEPVDFESNKIQVSGVAVSEIAMHPSHEDSKYSLLEWLKSQKIPVITEVDTRALTKYLRSRGTMVGGISEKTVDVKKLKIQPKIVSIKKPEVYNEKGTKKVILVDCGAKENILRSLIKLNLEVKKVQYDYDFTEEEYDGVLFSNGPGDPTDYLPTVEIAKKAIKVGKPIFGICLGTQIMALAAGAKTYKLLFGHRGHNQPCMDAQTNRCYVTSQNHGYAIDAKTLPSDWRVLYQNLNDGSVEGIEHKSLPFFSVQFHPEARPGPTDTEWLFERFYKSL